MSDVADERETWRQAYLLLEERGDDAGINAAMHAHAALKAGDLDGYDMWTRVARAVELLQAADAGRAVH